MKRLLLLLALAACSGKKAPPTCAQVCDHERTLALTHLEDALRRISDHSDPQTAAVLRAQADNARTTQHAMCFEQCGEADWDRACRVAAKTLDELARCR
jgi:hypothetical protein